ncbi:MAG: hypothetical protein ACI9L9_002550 [Marivirga sp.]|jgi:hypothetical protein
MKNSRLVSRIGMLALVIGMFTSTISFANCPTGGCLESPKSKDEIFAEKLESTVFIDQNLTDLEEDFITEGLLSTNGYILVKILNDADEVVYEGSYDGVSTDDLTLKRYIARADLMMNTGNTAYYIVF